MLEAYQSDSRWASLFTELRNLSDVSDIQTILKEANFHYEEHLNYLIKLDYSAGDVFGKIGARTRKNIRRGMKRSALDIFEAKDRSQIPACYDLLSQSYKNASVPLPDISLFYAAYEILLPRRMIDFTLAKVNGEAAAVSVELLYKDVVYGWYGGVDRKFGKYVPGEVVMWKVLERSCNQGYQVYDFGGAGKPDEEYGVRDFKAKFGGDLVCFGRNTWTSKPLLLAASELGYSLVRRILFN
jgi:predicted N-acyltransferase